MSGLLSNNLRSIGFVFNLFLIFPPPFQKQKRKKLQLEGTGEFLFKKRFPLSALVRLLLTSSQFRPLWGLLCLYLLLLNCEPTRCFCHALGAVIGIGSFLKDLSSLCQEFAGFTLEVSKSIFIEYGGFEYLLCLPDFRFKFRSA